ncbi:MAG: hypothetical protein ACOYOV_14320, partial [Bacteroidales bacterium]
MPIDCNLLNENVNSCDINSYKGFTKLAWWTDFENIDTDTIETSGNRVNFSLKSGQFWELYDGSKNPYSGSQIKPYFTEKHKYEAYDDVLALPLRSNTVGNAALATALAKGSRIVTILEQKERGTDDSARYVVLGLSDGLQIASGENAATADVAWELVLDDKNTSSSGLFLAGATANDVATNLNNLVGYEYITGLTIGVDGAFDDIKTYILNNVVSYDGNNYRCQVASVDNGITPDIDTTSWTAYSGQITVEVDADKTAYFIKPDGTKLTSTAGVIDSTYVGASGNCVIIVPKNKDVVFGTGGNVAVASDIIGSLIINTAISLDCVNCKSITSISSTSLISLDCTECGAITSLSAPLATALNCANCASLTSLSAPLAIYLY